MANTLADGLFHALVWVAGCVGLWLLWRPGHRAPALLDGRLVGLMLAGWGLFNLIEGLVDHQLLGIHRVKVEADGDPVVVLDVAFLVPGVLLLLVGSALARSLNAYPVRWRPSQ